MPVCRVLCVVVRFGGEVPLNPIASGACSARSPPIAVDMPSEDPETRGVAEGDPVDETLFVVRPPPSWAHLAFPFPSRPVLRPGSRLPRLPPDCARPPLSPTRSGAAARTVNSALTPPPSPPASARSTGPSPPPPRSPSPTVTASPVATPRTPPSPSSPAAATPPSSRGAARCTPGAGIRTTPSASTPRRSG